MKCILSTFSILILLQGISFNSVGEEDNKLKVDILGVAKPLNNDTGESGLFASGSFISDNEIWGVSLGTITYHVKKKNSFSLGWYHGTHLDLILPPKLDFSPLPNSFQSPQFVWDLLQVGLAGKIYLNEKINVVINTGIAPTLNFGFFTFENEFADSRSLKYLFGIGITPHIGTRLFLNERFSLGINQRIGKIKTRSYVRSGNSETTKSDPVKVKASTFSLNFSF